MNDLKNLLGEEDYKFFRNSSLWVKTHPERNYKFNEKLKPIRRDILDNLKNNILEGNGRLVDFDSLKPLFWEYFEKNKDIPISKAFEGIVVNLEDDTDFNLYSCLKILNFIRFNISLALEDIKTYRKSFFVENDDQIYSTGEYSLNLDIQREKYDSFLMQRFSQYNQTFGKGFFDLKNIVYYHVLKARFKYHSSFDFSSSTSIFYESGVAIKLSILSKMLEMLGIDENHYIISNI